MLMHLYSVIVNLLVFMYFLMKKQPTIAATILSTVTTVITFTDIRADTIMLYISLPSGNDNIVFIKQLSVDIHAGTLYLLNCPMNLVFLRLVQ